MGRSCGELTTKIHAVVDAEGRPIALDLTAGQVNDCQMSLPMLNIMREGAIILADKAYDTMPCVRSLRKRRHGPILRPKATAKAGFPSTAGFIDRETIERFFNKLKQFRGIATRYDKNPLNFLAAIKIVAIKIWINAL